jgi:putative copper export protein
MEALLILMRWLQFGAVLGLFGLALFPFYAGTPPHNGRMPLWLVLLALLSAVGWLACEAVLMSGNPHGYADRTVLLTVLTSTEFGHIWRWRLGLLAGLALYLTHLEIDTRRKTPLPFTGEATELWSSLSSAISEVVRAGFARKSACPHLPRLSPVSALRAPPGLRRGSLSRKRERNDDRSVSAVTLLIATLLLVTLAGIGHGAMGIGSGRWLHLGIQAVHLLAGGAWIGGLLALSLRLRQAPATITHALHRFSAVAFAAVLLVVATGLANAWLLVGSLPALWHIPYGQVLLVKLAFVAAMIGLALYNRCCLMPRLNDPATVRRLHYSLLVEQGCALLVLAAVSVLGTMMPAFDMPGMAM